MGFLNNFFGMNPTPTPVETVTPAKVTRKDDVLVTVPKKSSASIASAAPITNELIGIYEKLRAEALESNDVATADVYQSLIDEERERLKEEAKAAAKREAEAAEAAARQKAEEEKRRREAAEAAARQKAEEEKLRLAEEAEKAEFEAKARAIEPLLAYFTEYDRRAQILIEAIADTECGKKAIFNFVAATAE